MGCHVSFVLVAIFSFDVAVVDSVALYIHSSISSLQSFLLHMNYLLYRKIVFCLVLYIMIVIVYIEFIGQPKYKAQDFRQKVTRKTATDRYLLSGSAVASG